MGHQVEVSADPVRFRLLSASAVLSEVAHNSGQRHIMRGIESLGGAAIVERHRWRLTRRPGPYDDVAALREVEVPDVRASAVGRHAVNDDPCHGRRWQRRVLTA